MTPHGNDHSAQRAELLAADRRAPKRVVDVLALRGPMEREALAAEVGIGRSTLSRAVGRLLDARMLIEIDQPALGRGRPRTLLAVDPRRGSAVGFEFGLRHVRGALVDAANTVVATHEVDLPMDYGEDEAVPAVRRMFARFARRSTGAVVGVGLAVPGPVDSRTGVLSRSSILPEWAGRPIAAHFEDLLRCPVWADNDASLGAYGEVRWGAGAGVASLLYLKLHSGIGGGIVLDGRIYRGESGTAAEFGHLSYDPGGPLCRCGNRGCLETTAAVPAVVARVSAALGRTVTLADVLRLAADGDPRCCAVLASAGRDVGRALAGLSNALDPGRIVLGGELVRAGAPLLEPVHAEFAASTLPAHRDLPIDVGTLGRFGSALGAAGLVFASGFDDLLRRAETGRPPAPTGA